MSFRARCLVQGFVASVVIFAAGTAGAFDGPPFPRLAANWIANQNYQDPAIQRQLARGSVALISVWPGWERGRGTTVEEVIQNIKRINPNTLVFDYVVGNEISADRSSYSVYSEEYAKLDTMGWYLYSNGGCCAKVDSSWPGAVMLNTTLFAPSDSNGDRWVDWFAKWVVRNFATPNPSLDGFNTDNVFWKPRVNGDWNRDGVIDHQSDATVQSWYRQGVARHFNVLKQLMPGKLQIGNVADWGDARSVTTEYAGLLNGGVIEGMIGYNYSVETWGGWQAMMAWYRKTMGLLAQPKLGLFQQVGDPTDYRSFRYGFASAMMDDGYYIFNSLSAHGGDAPAFDEYNAKLGAALSGPAMTPWQKGVYRRDFENGIALVNPKGNGTQVLTLEADFKRLSGAQASSVNNGQVTRTVTLQDRDGLILLRTQVASPSKSPAAPRQVIVQ